MKKILLFLAVASTTMFVGCSKDDNGGKKNDPNAATAITLVSSLPSIMVGQSVTFTVTDNNAKDVTSSATFLANDVEISSATFTPTVAGSYSVKAFYTNSNDVVLTSNEVMITVDAVAVANDSFVIDNVNYETPSTLFQYTGLFELAPDTYVIGYRFNPFLEVGTGQAVTYPTDLYIYNLYPISPSGTDPETGDPTFTIEDPTTGNFNFATPPAASSVIDFQYTINNEVKLPTVFADRTAMITSANVNVTALDLTSDVTNLEATYSVTLTDGTVINGEYSGETGIYGLPAAPRAAKAIKASQADSKTRLILENYRKNNLKK